MLPRVGVPTGVFVPAGRVFVAVGGTGVPVVTVGVAVPVPGVLVGVGGLEPVGVTVPVAVGGTPTTTEPLVHSVPTGAWAGSSALALEQVSGWGPSAAFSAMAIV